MEKKYKTAVVLNLVPAILNLILSIYVFLNFTRAEFHGFFTGTILGILLSVLWLVQVRQAFGSHAIKLLKITFKGFFIKFFVFVVFIAGVYGVFHFSRLFFAAAFFIAIALGAIIELWFYSSISKSDV